VIDLDAAAGVGSGDGAGWISPDQVVQNAEAAAARDDDAVASVARDDVAVRVEGVCGVLDTASANRGVAAPRDGNATGNVPLGVAAGVQADVVTEDHGLVGRVGHADAVLGVAADAVEDVGRSEGGADGGVGGVALDHDAKKVRQGHVV